MVTYYKPQSPIQSGEDFIYPITTADQIMKSDNSRLEQNGEIVADNSPKLGGIAASEYALKTKTVPTSRTVNGKALSENITLSASDVKARNETWLPSTDNLKSIQMASWKGNTEPSGLPAGITHVSVSGSGKDDGFPIGFATCVAVNLDPSRCIQLLIEKTSGKLWTRSSTDGSSWGSWQSYLPALQMYPVGSIYMSVNSTSPASLFGGTWEQLKDRFLLGAGSAYAAGSTGGEATHKLSINEIPSHAGHLYGNAGGLGGKGDAKGKWLAEIKNNGSSTSYGWNYKNNEYYPVNRSLGGNAAHNNMPPYLAVYMWKRVS